MKNLYSTLKNICLAIIIIVLGFVSYQFIYIGLNAYEEKVLSYNSKSNINYKVYLNKNKFFETEYLEMDKTYISTLINYIDIDFDYNVDFDNIVSGNYTYYVNGTLLASRTSSTEGGNNYWEKTYTLTSPSLINYNETDKFSFNTNVKIDYQKYNTILKSFRDTYGISIDGKMRVELIVQSNSTSDILTDPVAIKSVASIDIPLTEKVIDISIDKNNTEVSDKVRETVQIKDFIHKLFVVLGIVLGLCDLTLIIVLIKGIKTIISKKSEYEKQLNRILSTYDSIIVNVKELPKYNDLKIIKTNTFEELIDAHSEVRMPINFVELEKNKRSKFVLVSENIVWEYTLENKKKGKR